MEPRLGCLSEAGQETGGTGRWGSSISAGYCLLLVARILTRRTSETWSWETSLGA